MSETTTITVIPDIDYDADGDTGLPDAIIGLKTVAGIETKDVDVCRGEINGDGKIGLEEVVHILGTLSGL